MQTCTWYFRYYGSFPSLTPKGNRRPTSRDCLGGRYCSATNGLLWNYYVGRCWRYKVSISLTAWGLHRSFWFGIFVQTGAMRSHVLGHQQVHVRLGTKVHVRFRTDQNQSTHCSTLDSTVQYVSHTRKILNCWYGFAHADWLATRPTVLCRFFLVPKQSCSTQVVVKYACCSLSL